MAESGHQRLEGARGAALEAPRGAHARQLAHEQPEIKPAGVHEHALQDVGMAAQVHAAQSSGFVEVRIGAFEPFAALPQQPSPAGAPNASTIGIHRFACRRLPRPVAPSAIRLRDVTPDPQGRERDHRLVAVVPLVADDLGEARPGRQHGFDCSAAVMSVSTMVVVSPSSASCTVTPTTAPVSRSTACSAVCAKCVRPSFIFVIFASGSWGCVQSSLDPFFFRDRSKRASSARVGVAMPEAAASRVSHASYASPVSRRTMLRMAALASSVVASMPIVCPCTRLASASRCNTHVKTA